MALLVLGSAVVLELAQLLTPDRHARLSDAAVKVLGGIAGIAVSAVANRMARR